MEGIKPIHYRLKLAPDLNRFLFSGDVEIELSAARPVRQVSLDMAELAVWACRVKVDDISVPCAFSVNPENKGLVVSLPKEMRGDISLHITYEGLINDKLAGIIGKENPIGTRLSYSGQHYSVIGVIQDYIPNPRWRVDEPVVLYQRPERYLFIFLKIDPQDIPQTLVQVKSIFERLNPAFPFEYEFMDETYEIQFNFIRRTRSLIAYLAISPLTSC